MAHEGERGGVLIGRFILSCLFEWRVPRVVVLRDYCVVQALRSVFLLAGHSRMWGAEALLPFGNIV